MFWRLKHPPEDVQTGDVRDPWEDEKQPSASVGDFFFVFLRTGKRTHTFLDVGINIPSNC